MTTAGLGDIYPVKVAGMIVVCVQLLLSVIFTTVIFAKGLSHFGNSTVTSLLRTEQTDTQQ